MTITTETLARMASDVAAGLVAPGYNKEYSQYDLPAKDVAERAVSIAYAIAGAVEAVERKRRDQGDAVIAKDWVAEAAKELEERIRSDSLYDNDVEVIIASHCPFKPGVAYMPVPRCETCNWWMRTGTDYGLCKMSSCDETISRLPPVEERDISSRDLLAVITRDRFGCVQWKEK